MRMISTVLSPGCGQVKDVYANAIQRWPSVERRCISMFKCDCACVYVLVFTCSSRPACYPLLSLEVSYVFVCLCMIVYVYMCTGSSRRACCALFNLEAAGADSGRTAHLVGRRLLHIGPAQNQHRPMQAMNPIHRRNLRKIKQRTNLAEKKGGEYLIFCIVLLEKDFLSTFTKNTTPIT